MVLEATVLCLDNSEWMRNGDYMPTRMEAQHDALNLICSAKTGANPENTVGVLTYAKKTSGSDGAEVVVTLTGDIGKILTSLHNIKLGGNPDLLSGLQVASLMLKHRQNKKQKQRVIVFVGSPITADVSQLTNLAKGLRKNNIAIDVVNFGEEAENTEKLEAFISAVNNEDNSHLVTIPSGPHILSDILVSSPILSSGGEGGAAPAGGPAAGGAVGGGFEFGVDPNVDPELAMALRMSMEEERRRQAKIAEAQQPPATTTEPAGTTEGTPATTAPATDVQMTEAPKEEAADEEDEEAQLAKALALSVVNPPQATPTPTSTPAPTTKDEPMEELSEEDEMAKAIQLSLKEPPPAPSGDVSEDMKGIDADFINSVVAGLPGVDTSDARIKNVLSNLKKDADKDKDKKDDKEKQ
jgi:26S proteasome regulatory subunit N10